MITQIFCILLFYFLGELVSYCIGGFIPGSVIGMLLLFLALVFRKIKPKSVHTVSKVLTNNMGLFFLPAAVGLMDSMDFIAHYWTIIATASCVSTLLVIASVGWIQQKLGKKTEEAQHE